jgi:hypothetical protein
MRHTVTAMHAAAGDDRGAADDDRIACVVLFDCAAVQFLFLLGAHLLILAFASVDDHTLLGLGFGGMYV